MRVHIISRFEFMENGSKVVGVYTDETKAREEAKRLNRQAKKEGYFRKDDGLTRWHEVKGHEVTE